MTTKTPYIDLTPAADQGPVPQNFIVFWGDDPAAWSTCAIAGVTIPGLTQIDGNGFENKVDRKKVPGTNGVKLTHIGYDPADFVIRTKLWTGDQFADYAQSVVPVIRPAKKGAPPQPVEVHHPALTFWGVSACLVLKGGIPKPNKEETPDFYIVELHCIEYMPPGKVTVQTAKKSVADLGPGAVGEKVNALKAQQSPAAQNKNPYASYPDQQGAANQSIPGT